MSVETLEMMETFSSISMKSSDSVSSETADEIWSPDPSSGYCSADDDPISYTRRTPATGTGRESYRRSSESSSEITSKSLLSLSLSEALALTFGESPPPSPPPDDDVLEDLASVDSRPPVSSFDCKSSLSSALPAPPSDGYPPIVLSRPGACRLLLRRVEPCSSETSNLEGQRDVERRTVAEEEDDHRQSNQTDSLSIEANFVDDLPNGWKSHPESPLQHSSFCRENTDPSGGQTTDWSNSSHSVPTCEIATIDEIGIELPEAPLNLECDASVYEETVEDDDTVYLMTDDGRLRRLLPVADTQLNSSIKEKTVFTPSHRLTHRLPNRLPRIEPLNDLSASLLEHSTSLIDEADLLRYNPDDFSLHLGATECHYSPHIVVDTDDTTGSTAPVRPAIPIGASTSMGPMTNTEAPVLTDINDSIDLRVLRVNVEFFHSYAAVKESADSCHSTATPCCSPQPKDLSLVDQGVYEDLSNHSMPQNNLLELQASFSALSQDLHDDGASISSTAAETTQERIKDVCDESSRTGSGTSSVDRSRVQTAALKRSRSTHRQSSKRRRRHANPALTELADHGYSLKAACRPACLPQSSTGPCVSIDEGETTSSADVSSCLARLLLTRDRLFPNEGSDGFIARRHCPESENSEEPAGSRGLSGSLLEKLLTGEMDHDEIQRSEERIIRDRIQARIDDNDDVDVADVDLRLQDFDPASVELENLEELWKTYGDLLGKFLS